MRASVVTRAIIQDFLLDIFLDLLEGSRLEPDKLWRKNGLRIRIKYVKYTLIFLKIILNVTHKCPRVEMSSPHQLFQTILIVVVILQHVIDVNIPKRRLLFHFHASYNVPNSVVAVFLVFLCKL